MPGSATPTRRLADILLGRDLAEYVDERRSTEPPTSWRRIARSVYEDTNGEIDVTAETLRLWFPDDLRADGDTAA